MNYPEFTREDIQVFHDIRDVSPISHMYAISFRIPVPVAFAAKDIYDEVEDKSRMKNPKLQQ